MRQNREAHFSQLALTWAELTLGSVHDLRLLFPLSVNDIDQIVQSSPMQQKKPARPAKDNEDYKFCKLNSVMSKKRLLANDMEFASSGNTVSYTDICAIPSWRTILRDSLEGKTVL